MSMVINLVEDHNIYLCEGGPVYNGGVQPTPITYLTQWKIVGNSEVHGNEIWSCGEYSATDGKYHIVVLPLGKSPVDIALDEPLRKVNDVADSIEFINGSAVLTRNLKEVGMATLNWRIFGSGVSNTYRYIAQVEDAYSYAASEFIKTINTGGYENARGNDTFYHQAEEQIIGMYEVSASFTYPAFAIYDPNYNQVDDLSALLTYLSDKRIIYRLATPTTEVIQVPQIEEAESYTCVISQGGKAVSWSDFITEEELLYAYGVEWDKEQESPELTRVGNMTYHSTLPVHSLMRGCLLNDNGDVVKYLNPSDWTSETLDGSQGQVMVEIPHFYWKFSEDVNGIRRVMISLKPLVGYKEVWSGKIYESAYQATLDRTNSKLASVKNTTAQYRGGNNTSTWDEDSQKTLLGRPATSISLTNFRTYARNRKTNSTEWNCNTYLMQKVLYWLFVVEYATLNSQKSFDNTLTTEGYKKGGLGAGVTNVNNTAWNSYSSINPFVPCGYTDSLGNGTGQASIVMPLGTNGADVTIYVPRYRGIENPFGHIWQWTDGVLANVQSGDDGESQCYVTTNPSDFSSSSYSDYTYIGNGPRTNNYIKDVLFGTDGDILAKTSQTNSPSSAKYYCDYHYVNIPTSSALRGLSFGGHSNYGSYAGLVCSRSDASPLAAAAFIGSRLNFLPATE